MPELPAAALVLEVGRCMTSLRERGVVLAGDGRYKRDRLLSSGSLIQSPVSSDYVE